MPTYKTEGKEFHREKQRNEEHAEKRVEWGI